MRSRARHISLAGMLTFIGIACIPLGIWVESARRQEHAIATITGLCPEFDSREVPVDGIRGFVARHLGASYVRTIRSLGIRYHTLGNPRSTPPEK